MVNSLEPVKLLFVCSRNEIRSLTAERILAGVPGYQVRSAGTETGARVRVSAGLLGWADRVFVMEKSHQARLRQRFPDAMQGKSIVCLHIRDEYSYMEEALVDALWATLSGYLSLPPPGEH